MKISFVLASMNLAGGTRVVLMLAEWLRRRGHDVLVTYPPLPRPSLRGRIVSSIRGENVIPNPELGYLHQLDLGIDVRVLESHRPVVDDDLPEADAVVATFWKTAEWVAGLAPSKGGQNVLHPTVRSELRPPEGPRRRDVGPAPAQNRLLPLAR